MTEDLNSQGSFPLVVVATEELTTGDLRKRQFRLWVTQGRMT